MGPEAIEMIIMTNAVYMYPCVNIRKPFDWGFFVVMLLSKLLLKGVNLSSVSIIISHMICLVQTGSFYSLNQGVN